ncbi:MAG: histidine--tRNA ligase [Bacteroidetes bacterium GWA2_30_7]|nr:MAG: histidine--tRNA ligase [Bacteroidetes bacterium GWA2_30_7]
MKPQTIKPSIPKGTRDFNPEEMLRRNYIFDTIKVVFQKFGFLPIETPAMENLTTLLGKYGDEGDRLIFKILNSGEFFEKAIENNNNLKTSKEILPFISEKALRYDLTVPFARYVVMNKNNIAFPFKRYQIQPVWRADRPQKGRYREFYQCDVDIIGSNSLLNELELIQIIDEIFTKLNIPIVIKLNNRKILTAIADFIGESEKITDITVAIDKIEKIGVEKVIEELVTKGISEKAIKLLKPFFELASKNLTSKKLIAELQKILQNSEIGQEGLTEISTIYNYLENIDCKADVEFDITLARGLNYYTGAIFEVKAKNIEFGSICGGGRYDDLTGIFGMPDVSGVGVSFGADRIYDVLNELKQFPESGNTSTKLMFVNFGEKEEIFCLKLLQQIRNAGINSELYPEHAKMKKQMSYADNKKIPFVALVGESEMLENLITLKNMKTGEQKNVVVEEVIEILK